MLKFTNRRVTLSAGVVLSVLLGAALSLPAHAAEIWTVNVAKPKFGTSASTLVLERNNGRSAASAADAKGNPSASTFLIISSGKLYLATDDADAASSGNGVKTVDYSRWRGMKFVQIGDRVRSADSCGFSCQSGLNQSAVIASHMTLTFTGKNVDAGRQMSTTLVFDR